ncbi:MAG: radical SAM protein [Planctomycetota bacterium]
MDTGELRERAIRAVRTLDECRGCPRDCGVDRARGDTGFCGTGRFARVASAFPHHGEEDCLRGTRGSGTIFFAGCNLGCVFCQNHDISQGDISQGDISQDPSAGQETTPEELASIMLGLERHGCHNVNLVSPSHVVPQIVEALALAVDFGLTVPVVYNTNAYDSLDSLARMDGLVSIYMPDVKFREPATAERLADAPDYPERMRAAVAEMHRQVGPLEIGPDGVARRGVLVRHLVMPGQGDETAAILHWLADEVSPATYVNLMGQYRPAHRVGPEFPEIDRRPTSEELRAAVAAAQAAGLARLDGVSQGRNEL